MPGIAISVTCRHCCDAHFAGRNERAAITDRAAFWHIANQQDLRFPCHHWLEQFLKLRQRRNPVKHDARAYDLERWRIECQRACALQHVCPVSSRNFGAKLLDDSSKSHDLSACEFRVLVRRGHMSRDAVDVDFRQRRPAFENLARFAFHHAHSSHPGIDFEIDRNEATVTRRLRVRSSLASDTIEPRVAAKSAEVLRFFETGNRGNKSVLWYDRSFLRSCRPENNDGMGEGLPERECLFQVSHAE